ncbi:AAA domain-containing protein [Helicobacter typhlonius]|uniref:AAA domain-containing protein n=1 Tax=Helicobacter typhlonius TaxID=76936 RepID=UPI002FE0B414
MNTSLREILVESAQRYYEYLDNNDLGLSEIAITRYELSNDELVLWLKGNVIDMDLKLGGALLLRVDKEFYSIAEGEEIESRFYDEKQKVLYLSLLPHIVAIFTKAQKDNIAFSVFSDLKFLVKNVEDFFSKYGHRVTLPKSITSNEIPHIAHLSDEQNQALSMVLTNPLSYVWGPPGTGKTQAVLFEALLHYIKLDKKVAVVAVTNNALEQVLKSLIRQFDELGFERSMILRLGTPTMQYMNDYPQTCDPNIMKQNKGVDLFNFEDSLTSRLKNALVVGVTLDGFIKRYGSLPLQFHHIFLDECAYAPLIKTCALCVDNTPLALFGDHKQLFPVCEMPLSEIAKEENKNASTWNLSALFLESFCKGEQLERLILLNEQGHTMPPLQDMALSTLSKTHRYGNNLARLLDKHIYHIGLRGTDSHIELFVCDSGSKSEVDKHISMNEVRSCARLCAQLGEREYAVITPFVKQRKALSQMIPRDRIFTIHGSQGQEFDDVIFSPVSLHYYLTDSRQTHALYALNVAISRTKKRLFIVCDYDFWSKQKNQLLYALLQECKNFDVAQGG